MITGLSAALAYLTPAERREVDAHVVALTTNAAHVAYQRDPIGWAHDTLGIPRETLVWSLSPEYAAHRWDGDVDPLAKMFRAVADWQDCGVESATGTGKSFGAAVLVLWFAACFENSQTFTFAPKEDQLRLFVWRTIGELWPQFRTHFPKAELTDLCLRMRGGTDESWAAHGYAVGVRAGETVSTKASGMHAEHMLLIYEECPGISQAVLEAGENTCTAPHNIRLAIGNPNHRLDPLHRFCTSPGVVAVRISALDHPNVVTGNANLIPGAVSGASIAKRRLKYGEASPVYQSRVRGESPHQASDALIRLDWLERANARWDARRTTLPRRVTGKGVDVANSEHGDRACIVDFADNVVIRVDAFQCPDANALGRQVAAEIDAANLPAARCGVDTIGVGAGTYNELQRLRHRVQGLVASSRPVARTAAAPDGGKYLWAADGNVFRTLRDQMYWQARVDLQTDQIDLERDWDLWEELTTPTFEDEPKTIVLGKDEIRALLGRSPDKADAFVMANWVRERRAPILPTYDDLPHKDPMVLLKTVDGRAPRWIGTEADDMDSVPSYMDQLPAGL